MEPYYVSALALYKVEFMLRNGHLEGKYRPARYHMIFALRILIAGDLPKWENSKKMKQYCEKISDALSDSNTSDKFIGEAARIIDEAAKETGLDRDSIRTERFTEAVKAAVLQAAVSPHS